MENRDFLVRKVVHGDMPKTIMISQDMQKAGAAAIKLARAEKGNDTLYFVGSIELEFHEGIVVTANGTAECVKKLIAALAHFNPWAYHDLMKILDPKTTFFPNMLSAPSFIDEKDPHWTSSPEDAASFIIEVVQALNLSPGLPDHLFFRTDGNDPDGMFQLKIEREILESEAQLIN